MLLAVVVVLPENLKVLPGCGLRHVRSSLATHATADVCVLQA